MPSVSLRCCDKANVTWNEVIEVMVIILLMIIAVLLLGIFYAVCLAGMAVEDAQRAPESLEAALARKYPTLYKR